MTENELLKLALSNVDRLKWFALRLCRDGDEADDLVQEGFIRALARRRQLREESRALAWLLSIVRSVFLQTRRRTHRQVELLEIDAARTEPAVGNLEEEMLRGALSDELTAALQALPDEWRSCLLLCVVDGLSYEEIAQVHRCQVGTVASRISRARARLLTSLHAAKHEVGQGADR